MLTENIGKQMDINEIIGRLHGVTKTGQDAWKAQCPAHHDTNASLSIGVRDNKILINCLAGCQTPDVCQAIGIKLSDLFMTPPSQSRPFDYGLTLDKYAAAKFLPLDALASWHVTDGNHVSQSGKSHPGVRMPYLDVNMRQQALRWRMRITKEHGTEPSRFLWEKNSKLCLYGLWLQPADRRHIILVEGESDSQVLWLNGFPCLGIPGAKNYRPERDDDAINQYGHIYVHIEKDDGGKALFERFAGDGNRIQPSVLLPKMLFFTLPGYKDPSDAWSMLHETPEQFRQLMTHALNSAKPADLFTRPDAWNAKKPDNRTQTSPANGAEGGRPSADYIGLAKLYAERFRDDDGNLKILHWRESWYQFDGRAYHAIPDGDMEGNAAAFLQSPAICSEYHVTPTTSCVRNLVMNTKSFNYAGVPAATRAPAWLPNLEPADGHIAMQNCIINLEKASQVVYNAATDGEGHLPSIDERNTYVSPLTPKLLSTFALPYGYDMFATCPNFDNWLSSTIPDPNVRKAIQMMMGLALVPDTTYNVCFFLAGEAGTGKSTFLDILTALVGNDNVCRVPLLKFDDKFATWPLAENLLNVVGEMPTDDPQGRLRYIEGDFKDSISGGNISCERKGKDACTARCTARHVFATNSLPLFFDKSEGIWDRLIIIPFEQRFRNSETEIRDIKTTMVPSELPGIFNFAIRGLAELRKYTRFPEPPQCKEAKQTHRERCDFDSSYLRDFYTPDEASAVRVSEAYEHYRTQLTANGLSPRSSPTFQAAVLRVFGIRVKRQSATDMTRVFKGIKANFQTTPTF